MRPLLEVGKSCQWLGPAKRSAVVIDACAYYAAFYRAASSAKHHILIAGWQFDTNVKLLRGDAAQNAKYPLEFLPFLKALCAERSDLRVYILAWDYSLVYSLEREWLQGLKFAFQSPDAIRFEFDTHPSLGGSHHQKFVVLDGVMAFVGGLDLCDERWDDRRHTTPHELRVSASGEACGANHEVQSVVQGAAAAPLLRLFADRWQTALGEQLDLQVGAESPLADLDISSVDTSAILPLRSERVAIARTLPGGAAPVREIATALCAALLAAQRLIYAETQYFTSRSVTAALMERMRDTAQPPLQVLVVMPRGADNSKEKFALGDLQSALLSDLQSVADTCGHQLRLLCSGTTGEDREAVTFIHSKLLIVDDELLCVGSANFTERSMSLDSELCLLWQGEPGSELCCDIRRVRASLLAEHSGQPLEDLLDVPGLTEKLDAAISAGSSRLRISHFEPTSISPLKQAIFDPGDRAAAPEPRRELGD